MRFEVKVGIWMRLLLWGSVLMFVPLFFFTAEDELFILFISMVVLALLLLPLMYFSYYELREDHLYIQMSIFRMRMFYKDITDVKKGKYSTHNNMAFSLEAVIIERKGKMMGGVSISPVDRDIFISELKRRCPAFNNPIDIDF